MDEVPNTLSNNQNSNGVETPATVASTSSTNVELNPHGNIEVEINRAQSNTEEESGQGEDRKMPAKPDINNKSS